MKLKMLRRQIDNIDKKVVSLLSRRATITLNISRLKQKIGKSIYSPEREREVLRKIVLLNKGPLANSALEAIYREIMSSSL
ncbi:MAG: chorismate mutase, partial [Candidatus Omnitrophica bacterium]|nr:chorismate mutase [Candidatus Omnitrophota bacterium]